MRWWAYRIVRVARVRGADRELPVGRTGEAPAGSGRIADRLSLAEARRLAINAQRLDGRPRTTRRAILETVEQIGYLQLDPTNVVARNHLLVLWSRLGRFDRADLDRLLWSDRALYETVSLIMPTSDRALHALRTRSIRRGEHPYWARMGAWVKKNERLRREVMGRLRREGSLEISAFEDRAAHGWTSSGWTNDRNVSQMLGFLLRLGHLAIGGRAGGRRVWTLADRWLPQVRPLPKATAARFATERALRALGVATLRDLRYAYAFGWAVTGEALAELVRDGKAKEVHVEGRRGPHFMPTSGEGRRPSSQPRTTLLSPFDNLIIQRERTEALFGFRYRMEIYVPKHLRVRGFFAMPILHRDRLIGSVDPKVDRERARLDVLTFKLEPDAPRDRATRQAVEDAVEDLAAFAGAREVTWPARIASSYSRR